MRLRESFSSSTTIPKRFFLEGDEGTLRNNASALMVQLPGGKVETTSRQDFKERVRALAMGFLSLGIKGGARVAIALENSPEWIVIDLALSSIGAVSVPIYTTLGKDDAAYILKDAEVSVLIASPKFAESFREIKALEHIITTSSSNDSALTLDRLLSRAGVSNGRALLDERVAAIKPEDLFSIIYSSGTTGPPKGVMLTHGNILSNIESVLSVVKITKDDRYLSYLPLSHIFERMIHHLLVYQGSTIAYSRGFAYVGADIALFAPSFMSGVPFFFERLKGRMLRGLEKAGLVKRVLISLSMKLNGLFTPRYNILDKVVLSALRERAVRGVRFFISGGAALSSDTAEFFWQLGLPVIQGYGLTETSPVVAVNTLSKNKLGTVGRVLPGVEIKLSETNEVLIKGAGVMEGYLNMPSATAEVIRDDWFHSGDVGHIDSDGYLTIVDRKKDIIVTSGGKNISPQKIEGLLRSDEYIREALVYGDDRPNLVALIIPEEPEEGLLPKDNAETFFAARIRDRLQGLARFEQIKRFAIITETLTVEGGEVTPTMKLKRDALAKKYADIIEGLYR